MVGFKKTCVLISLAMQLLTTGCSSNENKSVNAFFATQRNFPEYTQQELEERWSGVIAKHDEIRKGMSVEEVVAVLGLPDTDFAKHGKTAWVRPEENILQYSPGATATANNTNVLRVFHVHFDGKGRVSKTVKNGGFIFAPPPR